MRIIKSAFVTCTPVILGYLAAGFAFGLMITAIGRGILVAFVMSVVMYAGAGQYIAVDFIRDNSSYLSLAIATFLINSKHMFYGISLIEEFKASGWRMPYLIFSLTDETYALLTSVSFPKDICKSKYIMAVSVIDHISWICGCTLGAAFGTVVKFDTTGLDFAMTALFIVIIIDQLKVFKTRLPFLIGGGCSLFAMFAVGKSNMLLAGLALCAVILVLLRKRVERDDKACEEKEENVCQHKSL